MVNLLLLYCPLALCVSLGQSAAIFLQQLPASAHPWPQTSLELATHSWPDLSIRQPHALNSHSTSFPWKPSMGCQPGPARPPWHLLILTWDFTAAAAAASCRGSQPWLPVSSAQLCWAVTASHALPLPSATEAADYHCTAPTLLLLSADGETLGLLKRGIRF